MWHGLDLGVVVLAAGAGSRFGGQPGAKLLAALEGEPVLGHVLRAVREAGPRVSVVVLGHAADQIVRAIEWHDELPDRNVAETGEAEEPKQGLTKVIAGLFAFLFGTHRKKPGL